MEEIHYRLPIRNRGLHPGYHRSLSTGGGQEFHEYEYLLRAPDARRLDIQATLKNPFGDLMVRTFRQRSAISVTVVADLSASMGAPGDRGKLDLLARFIRMLGFSVSRTGDRFGFIGCDEQVRRDFLYPPAKWSSFRQVADRLGTFVPTGGSARGLAEAGYYLGRSLGLVFLVSDYLFPETLLGQALQRMSHHVVVPVMLNHPTELEGPAARGPVCARDSETGRSRMVWLRPSLRRQIQERFRDHQQRFERICTGHALKPLQLGAAFRADDITRYFYPAQGGAR